jgi:hypothetical protein
MGHPVSRGYKYGDLVHVGGWAWGCRPHPEKSQQLGNLRCGLGIVRSIRDDWEKSIEEAKVRIGL